MTRTLLLSLASLTLAACASSGPATLDGDHTGRAKELADDLVEDTGGDTGDTGDTGDFDPDLEEAEAEAEELATDPDGVEKRESCNCEDDDGDGAVDEGLKCRYKVDLDVTADDAVVAFADGAVMGFSTDWTSVSGFVTAMSAGTHHLAVKAKDLHHVQMGMIASVRVNGDLQTDLVTGAGGWSATATAPGAGWQTDLGILGGSSDAGMVASCSWGSWATPGLDADGAQWIWPGDCNTTTVDNDAWDEKSSGRPSL